MAEQIELKVSQAELRVEAGATTSARMTVRNTGTILGQYRLALEGRDTAWWEIVPAMVSLFPEDEATATLTIHPPAGTSPASQALQVSATSVGNPSYSVKVDIRLEMGSAGGALPREGAANAAAPPVAPEPPSAAEPPPTAARSRIAEPPVQREAAPTVQAPPPPPPPRAAERPPRQEDITAAGAPPVEAPARPPGQPDTRARVEIAISRGQFRVTVGGTATATATVYNRGTVVDQYELSAEGLDPTWWEVAPSTVSLFPGDEATVTLTLHPPAEALAGIHAFQVRAVSGDDPARSASVEATLEVAAVGSLLLALEPAIYRGRSGHYVAHLTNRANADARVTLAGRDREEALAFQFEPAALSVPAFGETTSSLLARPGSRRLWGQPRSYPFTVQALPEGEEEAAAEADGELEHVPLLRPAPLPTGRWRWLLAIIPLLALALLIRSLLQPGPEPTPTPTAVALAKPTTAAAAQPTQAGKDGGGGPQVSPPKIVSFEVVRQKPGFALVWKVAEADKVELNGAQVGLEGTQPIAEPKDQGHELKATNKGGTVIKRINTLVFPPPVVVSLRAEPPEIYRGQPSTLRWEVVGAERAKLDSREAGTPRGWLEVRPEATREYLLTAENAVGWVVQRVPVKVINAPPPEARLQTYRYDFKDSADDWELGAPVWSRVPWEGGYALRGAGHGFVRLTAHSGDLSSASFRFRLEGSDSGLQVNLLEGVEGPPGATSCPSGGMGSASIGRRGRRFESWRREASRLHPTFPTRRESRSGVAPSTCSWMVSRPWASTIPHRCRQDTRASSRWSGRPCTCSRSRCRSDRSHHHPRARLGPAGRGRSSGVRRLDAGFRQASTARGWEGGVRPPYSRGTGSR